MSTLEYAVCVGPYCRFCRCLDNGSDGRARLFTYTMRTVCLTATDHTTSKKLCYVMLLSDVTFYQYLSSILTVSDDRSQCWWITVLLINTRLHHFVVLILKSTTGYILLGTEICIINRVIRKHISKSCHLTVDQSIFQQLAMIIIQKFSSAATFFYSRCRLFMCFWFLGYVYYATLFCYHFPFFISLQTIFYFSSPVIM